MLSVDVRLLFEEVGLSFGYNLDSCLKIPIAWWKGQSCLSFNRATYLRQSIGSVLSQTFTDLELIIVDNASTDDTRSVVLPYMQADGRIRYVRNDSTISMCANFNRCLVVHQNVTVGTDLGRQPHLAEGVVICGDAAIIGNYEIGENVSVSAHSTVLNTSVPAGHVVAGMFPDLTIKPAKRRLVCEYFDMEADGRRSRRKPETCI